MFKKLLTKWRLFWNVCPECNSDAPELDTCQICQGYRTSDSGEVNSVLKANWIRRYNQAKCIHGLPMEDNCHNCGKMMHQLQSRQVNNVNNPRRG